jgi:hypothetical protein
VDRDLEVAAADPSFALELCVACWRNDWNLDGRVDERDLHMFDIEFDGKGWQARRPRSTPSPRQTHFAMPLEVDARLYANWAAVVGDLRRMLDSQEGLSLRQLAGIFVSAARTADVPNAYVDLGKLLREPTDIVIDVNDDLPRPQMYERMFRGMLGNGYAESMRASPLVERMRHMKAELDRGDDTVDRKVRYMMWLN